MRKTLVFFAALFALAVAVPTAGAANVNVAITKTGFVPTSLTIMQNDSVTWTNSDTQNHQVASQDAPFASPILKPTETFSYTFTKVGKFTITDPLVKQNKMTITVTAPAGGGGGGAVSLSVAPTLVTYGGKVTLTGTLANAKPGDQVTIEAKQCDASAYTKLATVTTTTGGAYTYATQPLKNTSYQVRFKNSTSTAVSVRVRPRITLGKIAPHRFTVRVRAAQSFAGKYVLVQRYNVALRRWVSLRSAVLRAGTGSVAPTVVSSVTFTSNVKARTKIRVVMSQTAVGSCYAPGTSNAILA